MIMIYDDNRFFLMMRRRGMRMMRMRRMRMMRMRRMRMMRMRWWGQWGYWKPLSSNNMCSRTKEYRVTQQESTETIPTNQVKTDTNIVNKIEWPPHGISMEFTSWCSSPKYLVLYHSYPSGSFCIPNVITLRWSHNCRPWDVRCRNNTFFESQTSFSSIASSAFLKILANNVSKKWLAVSGKQGWRLERLRVWGHGILNKISDIPIQLLLVEKHNAMHIN